MLRSCDITPYNKQGKITKTTDLYQQLIVIYLKVSSTSILNKFISWYQDSKSTESKQGRIMKGRSNDFLIRVLEGLCSGSASNSLKDDMAVFKEFSSEKDKSPEEIAAEKAFKNDPEKLKTWKQFQKEIQAAKK